MNPNIHTMPSPSAAQKSGVSLDIEHVYNLLMAEVEPDLTTHMIATLDVLYENETAEEHDERLQRYTQAFEEFAKRFAKAVGIWKREVHGWKAQVFGMLKEKAKGDEKNALADIERTMQNS